MGFREEGHRVKVPVSSHHVSSTCYQHDLSLLMLTLITLMRWCLSGFSTIKLLSPTSPLPYCPSWKGSHYAQPHSQWGVMFHLPEGRVSTQIIWNSSAWEICLYSPFIYVLNHFFLNSSMDSKMLIVLENGTGNQDRGTRYDPGMSLLLGPLSWESRKTYVCVLTCVHTHIYRYCISICIHLYLY